MKRLIIISLICAIYTITMSDRAADLRAYGESCISAFNANRKNVQLVLAGKIKKNDAEQNIRCAMKCILEKQGYFDNVTNTFLPDALRETVNETDSEMEKAITTCKDIKGKNPCDCAFQIIMCLWEFNL